MSPLIKKYQNQRLRCQRLMLWALKTGKYRWFNYLESIERIYIGRIKWLKQEPQS